MIILGAATFIGVLVLSVALAAVLHLALERGRIPKPVKAIKHQGFDLYRLDDGWHALRQSDGLYLNAGTYEEVLDSIEEIGVTEEH